MTAAVVVVAGKGSAVAPAVVVAVIKVKISN